MKDSANNTHYQYTIMLIHFPYNKVEHSSIYCVSIIVVKQLMRIAIVECMVKKTSKKKKTAVSLI